MPDCPIQIGLNSSVNDLFAARTAAEGAARERTGRKIITWKKEAGAAGNKLLESKAGLAVVNAADFQATGIDASRLPAMGALFLPTLNISIVHAEPEQMNMLSVQDVAENPVLAIEPEYFVYAQSDEQAYIRGFRDGVDALSDRLLGRPAPALVVQQTAQPAGAATWGLMACRVPGSRFTGVGIKVAVLDTGLDLSHPDFQGRAITSQSFVDGEEVQDGYGHGTHCIGTSCGPTSPPLGPPRYGVAGSAEIFVGKVLNNLGGGTDGSILAGIDWSLAKGCHIISMSLGRRVPPGEPPQQAYEAAGSRALAVGCLIVAAAGNDSQRPDIILPVGSPANASTILAAASIGEDLNISFFSNGGINADGGEVNIAGPGENVFSTVPMPGRYGLKSGTSMATPHVAGVAVLLAGSDQSLRGQALWKRLTETAKPLPLPAKEVGAGLVQAP